MSGIRPPQALVLGADGVAGAGVVAALLDAGVPVLAVGAEAGLRALALRHAATPALSLHACALENEDDAAALAVSLRQRGRPLRAVFACLGGAPQRGRLLEQPVRDLREKLDRELTPHLAAARHLLPLLARAGDTTHYILIGGPHAEHGWSGYGPTSVAAAALRMLAHVLHQEAQPLGVRVQMLSVDRPISTPANRHSACREWPDALAVGRCAVSLLNRSGVPPQPIVPYALACTDPLPLSGVPPRQQDTDFHRGGAASA